MSPRFYAVPNPERVAEECRRWWGLSGDEQIGPVDTNMPDTTPAISLVVVLESPSEKEVLAGHPAVHWTGTCVMRRWQESRHPSLGPSKWKMDYPRFANEGIYLTELVRCRADIGDVGERVKNKRVSDAWEKGHHQYLRDELGRIAAKFPGTPVLFACGISFDHLVRDAGSYAGEIGLRWFASYHPSRMVHELAWHYNPLTWIGLPRFPSERVGAIVGRAMAPKPEEDASGRLPT